MRDTSYPCATILSISSSLSGDPKTLCRTLRRLRLMLRHYGLRDHALGVPLSIRNRSSLTGLTFMVLLFQHPAGLGRAPQVCGWRALRQRFITGKTRYAGNASLGRRHGAGVRLSHPFFGKPKSAIRQTIYRLLSEPTQPNVNQAYPQNCSPR